MKTRSLLAVTLLAMLAIPLTAQAQGTLRVPTCRPDAELLSALATITRDAVNSALFDTEDDGILYDFHSTRVGCKRSDKRTESTRAGLEKVSCVPSESVFS